MQTITAEELKTKIDSVGKPVLLDVREGWEYNICSIPGSINISMSNVNQMLDELVSTDEIIVICHHGMRSYQVGSYLEHNGFSNIVNLAGGIDAWAKTVDPDMEQY